MSIDVSQVEEMVANDGYEALFEGYESITPVYPLLGRVINTTDAGVPEYGDKGSVFAGHQRPLKREDLQEIEKSTTDKAWTWQCAIHQYARGHRIPSRLLRSQGASAMRRVKADLLQWAQDVGQVSIHTKEEIIAGMFQKGTLTAGSSKFFDNSYVGNADSNAGFIYDGLPWFDTAHTSLSGDTYTNHIASATLSQTTLQNALTAMKVTNAKDDRGDRVMIRPNVLLVPGGMEYTARTVVQSPQASGTANNDINPIAGSLQVLPWNFLDDAASAAAWWLVQAGRGLRIYDSGAPRLWVVQEDNGDITVNYEFLFGAAVDNWRYAHCNNKAAS